MALFSMVLELLDDNERTSLRRSTRPFIFMDHSMFDLPCLEGISEASVKRVTEVYSGSVDEAGETGDRRLAWQSETGIPLIERIDLGKASIRELKLLRRKIAWLCHPDRRLTDSSCTVIAEANARLDEAIKRAMN